VARRRLTGVLLVGGESRRFGSPKAHARFDGETLAERAWRVLGEASDERLAVGKRGELDLPFEVLDDGTDVRAPIAGVVAGLRAATNDIVVFLPVDAPRVTADALRALGDACRDAALAEGWPLPAAYAKSALPVLERRLAEGELALRDTFGELDAAIVDLDAALLADADTRAELERLERA
jgi:molybdopterin-guanine dinucleotide biosynthesis protein A